MWLVRTGCIDYLRGFPVGFSTVAPSVENLPANAGAVTDVSLTRTLGSNNGKVGKIARGGGDGNPLQYFCLKNPMDREAWQAADHRVAKSYMTKAT